MVADLCSFCGVVMHLLVRASLFSGHGSFVTKKRKKNIKFVLILLREGISRAFDNTGKWTEQLKNPLCIIFWSRSECK